MCRELTNETDFQQCTISLSLYISISISIYRSHYRSSNMKAYSTVYKCLHFISDILKPEFICSCAASYIVNHYKNHSAQKADSKPSQAIHLKGPS